MNTNEFVQKVQMAILAVFSVFVMSSAGWAFAMTIEAEDATIKTAGWPVDNGWNLHSNGTVGEYIRIQESGTYEVTIYAHGSPLKGIWPLMAINLDGLATETKTVNTSEFTPYIFQVKLSQGVHAIGGTFFNDAYEPGIEDRNLYFDKFEIRSAKVLEEPVIASEEEWILEAKEREDAVLQKADEAIKKNRMGSGTITVLDGDGNPLAGVSVTIDQIQHDFLFGSNIFRFNELETEEENITYLKLFQELFNYATVPFYWKSFEPEQGKPRYPYMDEIVTWCKNRGIRLKGHPLLWDHEVGIPPWSDGLPPPEAQQKRVSEIIQRYEGKIEFWEVVNEPAHLDGIPIDIPYHLARESSPGAYLIVNDYEMLADGGYPPFFDLLKEAIQNGVPFDGIGIQAHSPDDMAFPLDRVQALFDIYATFGKEIHVTEFAPASNGKAVIGSSWRDIWDEAQQADYAEKFYRVCFANEAVVAITWWDLTDQGSWREYGGMLRNDLSPKPVYETLKNLIKEEWHTYHEGKTDDSGSFPFSAYYGRYRIAIRKDGISKETEFHLGKGKGNNFNYELEIKSITFPTNFRIIDTR